MLGTIYMAPVCVYRTMFYLVLGVALAQSGALDGTEPIAINGTNVGEDPSLYERYPFAIHGTAILQRLAYGHQGYCNFDGYSFVDKDDLNHRFSTLSARYFTICNEASNPQPPEIKPTLEQLINAPICKNHEAMTIAGAKEACAHEPLCDGFQWISSTNNLTKAQADKAKGEARYYTLAPLGQNDGYNPYDGDQMAIKPAACYRKRYLVPDFTEPMHQIKTGLLTANSIYVTTDHANMKHMHRFLIAVFVIFWSYMLATVVVNVLGLHKSYQTILVRMYPNFRTPEGVQANMYSMFY